ncbi:MAG: hypothetical protein DRN57_07840 [Thermoplasmata archaeon]|nr:MAG: hypothetical protein DRN57_07840 [Thermoplasmata archaeon]
MQPKRLLFNRRPPEGLLKALERVESMRDKGAKRAASWKLHIDARFTPTRRRLTYKKRGMYSLIILYITAFLVIIPGCLGPKDNITWAEVGELELNMELVNYSVEYHAGMNSSLITLNITIENVCENTVYVPETLMFDMNVDGVIIEPDNSTYCLNTYWGYYPRPTWKEPSELNPGESKSSELYVGVYENENYTFPEERIHLDSDLQYRLICWYFQDQVKIYSNEIIFSPSEWDDHS